MHLIGYHIAPPTALMILAVASIILPQATYAQTTSPSASATTDSTAEKELRVPDELWRAGFSGAASLNLHLARRIRGVPGVPSCCPAFTDGNGNGFAIRLLGELPLGDLLRVGFRVGVTSYTGSLVQEQFEEVNVEQGITVGRFEHSVKAELFAVGLGAVLAFEPVDQLYVFAGLQGDYMLSADYHQKEVLTSPEGVTFENGKRIRLEGSGPIPDPAVLYPSVIGGIRFDLPLNRYRTWILAPELAASYGLVDIMKDVPWSVHSGSVGLSLTYVMRKQPELQRTPLDLMIPIESKPADSPGTERDE